VARLTKKAMEAAEAEVEKERGKASAARKALRAARDEGRHQMVGALTGLGLGQVNQLLSPKLAEMLPDSLKPFAEPLALWAGGMLGSMVAPKDVRPMVRGQSAAVAASRVDLGAVTNAVNSLGGGQQQQQQQQFPDLRPMVRLPMVQPAALPVMAPPVPAPTASRAPARAPIDLDGNPFG
jgi:hypothetical protein